MDKPNHVPPGSAAPRHVGMTAADAMRKTKKDYSQTIDDLRGIEMLDRVLKRTTDRMSEPQPHNWTVPVFIALLIVTLLMLGLSLDVQATVDAVNEGLDL